MRLDIDKVTLQSGAHESPEQGMCVMEAVAYIARERFSDSPICVSPVIATFLRAWNDGLNDDDRQKLKALIPVVMDSASTPEDEERRAWMALDWLVRVHAPAWLRLANLTDQADTLANLPRFKAGMDLPSVQPAIEAVRRDAAAAGDAAWAAAWAAAGDAARDAAGDAVRDAVGAAAWGAAWAAAGDAVRDAVGAAAWGAARAAARAAAWGAAGDAVGAAARVALRPTVEALQASAFELVEAMVYLKDEDG